MFAIEDRQHAPGAVPSGLDQRTPDQPALRIASVIAEPEALGLAPGVGVDREESSGHDPRIVRDQQITWVEQSGQVAHDPVLEARRIAPADNQEAGAIAGLHRGGRDQLGREVKIEVVNTHAGTLRIVGVFTSHNIRRCVMSRVGVFFGIDPSLR